MAFGPETIGFGFPVHGVEVTLCTEMLGAFGRLQVGGMCADLRNHLAQQIRVFQHGARAQVVLVERLAIVVRHEERRLQDFEQCFFANVGIGIVDEHARVGVAAGVDIQVYAELFAMRDGRNYRENKSAGLP